MKVTMVALVVSADMLLLAAAAANAQARAERECTNAALEGRYGILQTGVDAAGNARNGVGVVTFDGRGTWSLALTEIQKEGPIQHVTNSNGTYTVNANCTGSASLARTPFGVANWEFVIVGDGNEVFQVVTTPPRGVTTWLLKKQFVR